METRAEDLSGTVTPDAVPFTPEVGDEGPNPYRVVPRPTPAQQSPGNAQQGTAPAHQVPSGGRHHGAAAPAARTQTKPSAGKSGPSCCCWP